MPSGIGTIGGESPFSNTVLNMTRPPFSQYLEAAVSRLNRELCALPTYTLSAVNDGAMSVDDLVNLPILTPGTDPEAVALSLVKRELSRRDETLKWGKAKIAAISAIAAATISASLALLG